MEFQYRHSWQYLAIVRLGTPTTTPEFSYGTPLSTQQNKWNWGVLQNLSYIDLKEFSELQMPNANSIHMGTKIYWWQFDTVTW